MPDDLKTTLAELEEARVIFNALHTMGPGLTINDRVVYIAGCLSKARRQGHSDGYLECMREWQTTR